MIVAWHVCAGFYYSRQIDLHMRTLSNNFSNHCKCVDFLRLFLPHPTSSNPLTARFKPRLPYVISLAQSNCFLLQPPQNLFSLVASLHCRQKALRKKISSNGRPNIWKYQRMWLYTWNFRPRKEGGENDMGNTFCALWEQKCTSFKPFGFSIWPTSKCKSNTKFQGCLAKIFMAIQ